MTGIWQRLIWVDGCGCNPPGWDQWLQSGRTALLRLPSVIVPATLNVLINPLHPESGRIRIIREHRHSLDTRLMR